MDDQFEDGPVCDFCEIAVDKGETLEPIYVGELPQPKPHYLSEVRQKGDNYHLLGKSIGVYAAMYEALRNCPDIDINESEVVEEVTAVGGESHFVTEESMEYGSTPGLRQGVRGDVELETRTNRDKVGVELRIRPKDVTYQPDAEVCDTCAEMFRSLGSD